MLRSSIRNRARGNMPWNASPDVRVDGLPPRRVRRLRGVGRDALRLPEDRRDVVRELQHLLRSREVDLLASLRPRLQGHPHEVVELGELLDVLRLEVVRQ